MIRTFRIVGVACLAALLAGGSGAAQTVTYTYDALGRVRKAVYSSGDQVEYFYDAAGNLTQKVTTAAAVSAPTVGAGSLTTAYNTPGTAALTPSGNWSSLAIASGPSHGSASISGTTATYTPATNYSGSDSFTYTATGPGGTSSPATISITVSPGYSGFTQTIQITGSGPVNLRALANTVGYNGAQNATITFEVGNGVTIMGDQGGAAWGPDTGVGVDTGIWPSGYTTNLTLLVKSGGKVYGGGGNGGEGAATYGGGSGGTPGGDAIYARTPISITVQSGALVAGGGHGGSGGAGQDWWDPYTYWDNCWGGGGGGGGFPNGAGGAGGNTYQFPYYGCFAGASGSEGTESGGGAGGTGGSGTGTSNYYWYGSDGEAGNAAGGGYAIRKNGHTVPVSNSGTIIGPQS